MTILKKHMSQRKATEWFLKYEKEHPEKVIYKAADLIEAFHCGYEKAEKDNNGQLGTDNSKEK